MTIMADKDNNMQIIDSGRPCFVSGFREFEFRVLGMEELRQTSGIVNHMYC